MKRFQFDTFFTFIVVGIIVFSIGYVSGARTSAAVAKESIPAMAIAIADVEPEPHETIEDVFTLSEVMAWWLQGRNPKLSSEECLDIAATILTKTEEHAPEIDPLMVMALIDLESECIIGARGASSEVGLMQVMPSTGRWLADKLNIEYNTNLETNITLGIFYLGDIYRRHRNYHTALTAYNRGEKGMENYRNANGTSHTAYSRQVIRRYNALCKAMKEGEEYVKAYNPTYALAHTPAEK